VLLPVAIDRDLAALRERVRHRDADAVQPAGDVIDRIAALREELPPA
jgi:hypothetical protein